MKTAVAYDRRKFLTQLGVGMAMLPMLESEAALAADGESHLRFLSFVVTNGMPVNNFFPTGTQSNYTLSETCSLLEPVKSKITFVQGLQFRTMIDVPFSVAGHHDLAGVLTGMPILQYSDPQAISVAGGPSIDQHIVAQARLANPAEGRPLLIAYQGEREPQTSWTGASAPQTAQSDLYKLYNSLFMQNGTTPASIDQDYLNKLRAGRRSMLDVVGKSIQRFARNLGRADQLRVENHLQSFREIEKTFGATMTGNTSFTPATLTESFSSTDVADMPKYMDALTKLITAAFASNISRCINFTFGDSVGDSLSYPHLGFPRVNDVSIYDGGSGVDHGEAHNNTKVHVAARRWLLGEFAKLVTSLSEVVVDNNGKSLLDNSVLYMTPNMATGGSHDVGRGIDMPTLYAGSCGGYLRTGSYVKLTGERHAHNRLFQSIFSAMNIDPAGFDNERYGGELTELKA